MSDRTAVILGFIFLVSVLFAVGVAAEQPLDSKERKALVQTQRDFSARQAKIQYVHNAMIRTELRDDDFVIEGRRDINALGADLLKCWYDLGESKKPLLQKKP